MTTLLGIDLAGRRVLVAGAGAVGTRRARGLAAEGAHVALVDPSPSDAVRALAQAPPGGRVELVRRRAREQDVDGAWLAVTASGVAAVDDEVARWCEERQVFVVRGGTGSARTAATTRHGDVLVGVVSTGAPDPGRAVSVRDALAAHLSSGRVDLRRRRPGAGRVVLVGGGPGDAGLVTVAGMAALAGADVVVTDRLGASGLLHGLADGVEVVDVGKDPHHHPVPQADINRILVERARQGRVVVRLKGGDPFVYGRGGEEVHACRVAGVAVEVVPGVTSAFAAPALAGIPVTQREVAGSVLVASGHAGADPAALAALTAGATVVLLMAVRALPEICAAALAAGVAADLPVAAVERASEPDQRVTRATLGTATEVMAAAGVRAPAVVVLGPVAAQGFLDTPACATEAVDA